MGRYVPMPKVRVYFSLIDFLWHLLNAKSPFISGLVVDMSKTKKINSKPPIISGLNVNLSKVKRN